MLLKLLKEKLKEKKTFDNEYQKLFHEGFQTGLEEAIKIFQSLDWDAKELELLNKGSGLTKEQRIGASLVLLWLGSE